MKSESDRLKGELNRLALIRQTSVNATSFICGWPSYSRPAAVECDDGLEYVVKGRQVGRAIVNEQVVAHLGLALGAPVGKPRLINMPSDLIKYESNLAHFVPGICHGNLFERNCSDRAWIAYTDKQENRSRFALLSVLYGWAYAGDHQLIYSNAPPHLVYSVDHGHFFPGGPNWCEIDLQYSSCNLDPSLKTDCNLTPDEINKAGAALACITENQILEAVAAPPDEWGITIDERLALVRYLIDRRSELLLNIKNTV
jgi:hypothetical protein